MSKHFGRKSVITSIVALATVGLFGLSSSPAVTADDSAQGDYYSVVGPSQIVTSEFPPLYTTTEKVYKKQGTNTNRVTVSDIHYSQLDGYKRSGMAYGVITNDMINMSKGYRETWEPNSDPSGWYKYYRLSDNAQISENEYDAQKTKAKKVKNNPAVVLTRLDGHKYNSHLFVRSHLFADSLGGRAFRNNVIMGTQMQNVGTHKGGMQYIERKVLNYIKQHPQVHVYYKAVPEYQGTELIPRSVLVSALSSDKKIDETVRVFNTAQGFAIDYQNGGLLNTPVSEDTTPDDITGLPVDETLDDAA